ncbi:CDP-alcohol phosphatidyltransferase family protein [Sphingomonas oligophenolica]|uniref:CDP-alcohol phosphatidyltransferase family protein n=1 Tax=Sphingomonas oligophenolica TaxID=301154 RepID=A0A502CQP2_9SPHN|nr:CDP-alcohol phosphatidyltransferase family protein [Sphingomonas oligophenolica]TPG14439.1 CDP-alcohol phosphatidyltransferase family protein [Sphingomonas oligophenolica]
MTTPPPDGSRDRRIEDPSNLWIIHPAGRALLPRALTLGVSANSVSIAGLVLGGAAAFAYTQWDSPVFALVGLLFSIGWLIADGLDGMIARATHTASALGRALDGLCDHGVFALIYISLALSIGTAGGWALALTAGLAHAIQSSLYEGERARFHRRIKGVALAVPPAPTGMLLVRIYDSVAGSLDRVSMPFERRMARAADPVAFGRRYGESAAAPLRFMSLLTANMRVFAIFIACLAGNPRIFWWIEIVPMTIILVTGIALHRRIERQLAGGVSPSIRLSNEQGNT